MILQSVGISSFLTKPKNGKYSDLRAEYEGVHAELTEKFDFLFRGALWRL